MNKELFVSSTPHETRVAVREDEQLAEIYFERENEYTLAGSIYKGRVTRVLPGMQSAFVDIGLERDAFLYVTDFMEEAEDEEGFEQIVSQAHIEASANQQRTGPPAASETAAASPGVEHPGAPPARETGAAEVGGATAENVGGLAAALPGDPVPQSGTQELSLIHI